MGINLGLVGLGSFGSAFAPLFASHPLVDSVILCDVEPDKIAKQLENPIIARKTSAKVLSLDEVCKSDCDAVVVITQPWLHAPQCIQAMEAGKYVYSAVPVSCVPDDEEILDWCGKIIDTVRRTGMEYMLGETTIYRPQTMFCRRMAQQGLFGDFVYAEAEYTHDVDTAGCSLREVRAWRTKGKVGEMHDKIMAPYWQRGCKEHPMSYPTHSVSGVVDVMGCRPLTVSAIGYRNANNDPFFEHNDFSNITAFFRMDNGCAVRVAEMREISYNLGLCDEDFRIFGTRGSYSLTRWCSNGRTAPTPEQKPNKETIYTLEEMRDPLPPEVFEAFSEAMADEGSGKGDFFAGGHGGSHPYLVHEFVSAVAERRRPRISAWDAAMYMSMGVAAHKSACRDGEIVKVFDFGTR